MQKLDTYNFLAVLSRLNSIDALAQKKPEIIYDDPERRNWLVRNLSALLDHLTTLKLRLSAKKAEHIQFLIANNPNPSDTSALAVLVTSGLVELRERIEGEIELLSAFFVDTEKGQLLSSSEAPFGEMVADAFPSSITDIYEATLCLGLSRNTACVFHLMRAMEDAVKRLGEKLGATTESLEWGKILANMKAPVEGLPKGPNRDAWSEILTLLYHVKQKWRNGTMHPKQTYTNDEATTVYQAVRSFLQHLAPLMLEKTDDPKRPV